MEDNQDVTNKSECDEILDCENESISVSDIAERSECDSVSIGKSSETSSESSDESSVSIDQGIDTRLNSNNKVYKDADTTETAATADTTISALSNITSEDESIQQVRSTDTRKSLPSSIDVRKYLCIHLYLAA